MHPLTLAASSATLCLVAALASPAFALQQSGAPAVQTTARLSADLDATFGDLPLTEPGCVAGVVVGGASSIRAYGQSDLEHAAALAPDSVFESGSLAKQFTATAILLLAQDGKLTLDDDIRRYLPEMPDYGSVITIRHLLTHTSGLREQWSLLALTGNTPGTQVHDQRTILDLASRQTGLNFILGTEFLYTNTNYTLAAIVIERVSGQSLQQFTDQRLFQPLGMSRTRWREDFRTVVPGRAMAYAPSDAGFIANMPFTNVRGNGGLLTTAGDMLRWNAFLDSPADLPGGEDIVAALQTPGRLSDGTPLEYGLGLDVDRRHGQRLISHSGSTGGYKAWLGRYPDQGVSVVVLCNNGGINPVTLGQRLADRELGSTGQTLADASPRPPAVSPSPAPAQASPSGEALSVYVGTYYSAELDTRISVVRRGETLVMSQPFATEWPLTPSVVDGFTTRLRGTTTFIFSRTADGQIDGFGAWATGARDIRFVKQ